MMDCLFTVNRLVPIIVFFLHERSVFTHDSHTHVGPLYLTFTLHWAHRRNPRFSILPEDTRAARDWTNNLPNSRWPALAEIPVFLCTTGTGEWSSYCDYTVQKIHAKFTWSPGTSQTAASIDSVRAGESMPHSVRVTLSPLKSKKSLLLSTLLKITMNTLTFDLRGKLCSVPGFKQLQLFIQVKNSQLNAPGA